MLNQKIISILKLVLYLSCFFHISSKTTYIFGHKNPDSDTITSAIALANFEKHMGNSNIIYPCRLGELNKETKYILSVFKFPTPLLITNSTDADEVILVDHSSPSQGPEDITRANIVMIIDHHGMDKFQKSTPIDILTRKVGSTCTIIYSLYELYHVPISKRIAGLLMSGIISDTLLLKSVITTQEDKDAVSKLSKIAGVDYQTYGRTMLATGTDYSDMTDKQIINFDSKEYTSNKYKYFIACANALNETALLKRKEGILKEMNNEIKANNLSLFVFSIYDILNSNAHLIVEGEKIKVVEMAFNVTVNENYAFVKNITSRKLQLYPLIDAAFKKL